MKRSPVVTGFVANKANVAAKTVKAGDANSEGLYNTSSVHTYQMYQTDFKSTKPSISNDPNNPTKPGTDLPVVPDVPELHQ